MSTVAFIRRMLVAGFTHEDALRAAEAFEATATEMLPTRSKGAARQARYAERKRQKASESVSTDATDAMVSPSPSPPDPPNPAPIREEIYTPRARAADFEAFWQAYPAKVGKKAAEAAWAKAKDRPPLDEVLAAIDAYRRAKPPDRDWCHPSTWLNQGRWSDEAPAPTTRPGVPRNDRPDRFAAKQQNYAASWSGADGADQVLASRREF